VASLSGTQCFEAILICRCFSFPRIAAEIAANRMQDPYRPSADGRSGPSSSIVETNISLLCAGPSFQMAESCINRRGERCFSKLDLRKKSRAESRSEVVKIPWRKNPLQL
jgi:hypothetical protein